jgi:antitoxin (DNA-binding transcriptional repressor) of toxin-antitoxin stability system
MLAELAAANAAFAVIKQCVQNGRELTSAGEAIAKFVTAKEELQRKGSKKKARGVNTPDLEEFMALEKIREQEEQLKQFMIYAGRPGLWNDWQKFQAEARKSRRVQEELAKRRREEIIEMMGYGLVAVIIVGVLIAFAFWALWMKGGI